MALKINFFGFGSDCLIFQLLNFYSKEIEAWLYIDLAIINVALILGACKMEEL